MVQGNRISTADLGVPVDQAVLAGRVRLPRKADQVVRGNRMGVADPEALVDQVVLAGQAPIKQGSLVVLVARGASRNARRTANSSRKVIQSVRAST